MTNQEIKQFILARVEERKAQGFEFVTDLYLCKLGSRGVCGCLMGAITPFNEAQPGANFTEDVTAKVTGIEYPKLSAIEAGFSRFGDDDQTTIKAKKDFLELYMFGQELSKELIGD